MAGVEKAMNGMENETNYHFDIVLNLVGESIMKNLKNNSPTI